MSKFCVQALNMSKGSIKNGVWCGLRSEQFIYYMRNNEMFKDTRTSKYAYHKSQVPLDRKTFDAIWRSYRIKKFLTKD